MYKAIELLLNKKITASNIGRVTDLSILPPFFITIHPIYFIVSDPQAKVFLVMML